MASTFSFGFSGDDIDIDVDENDRPSSLNDLNRRDSSSASASLPKLVEAKRHFLHEWVCILSI
jgi:protein-histidine N-methyltransferase